MGPAQGPNGYLDDLAHHRSLAVAITAGRPRSEDVSRPLSLRNRLILLAAACMLPLLLVVGVILAETLDAGRDQVLDAQAATAEVVASVLGSILDENRTVLQELGSIDRIRRMEAQ